MTKPSRSFPRPLSELLGATLNDVMKNAGIRLDRNHLALG